MSNQYRSNRYCERWQYVYDILNAQKIKVKDFAIIVGHSERTLRRTLKSQRVVCLEEVKEISIGLAKITGKKWEYHLIEITRKNK